MENNSIGIRDQYDKQAEAIFKNDLIYGINALAAEAHANAVNHGWWEENRSDAECIALMHSELSEALEYARNGNPMSDHIPEFDGLTEEMADCIIRILDFSGARKLKLGEVIIAKMKFNESRPYKHGKEF